MKILTKPIKMQNQYNLQNEVLPQKIIRVVFEG